MKTHIFLNSYRFKEIGTNKPAQFGSDYANDVLIQPEPTNSNFVSISHQGHEVILGREELMKALGAIERAVR